MLASLCSFYDILANWLNFSVSVTTVHKVSIFKAHTSFGSNCEQRKSVACLACQFVGGWVTGRPVGRSVGVFV